MDKKTTADSGRTQPMVAGSTRHFIERTYRESGEFQWVRETFMNAVEAGATRVEFGIEWQAVEKLGVYRRTIIDDGRGMSEDELKEFFNTFGGGGKAIGGVHENFGVGSKTSLLPWNSYGVVVVSWRDDEASMIWLHLDEELGEYGLRVIECEDETGSPVLETAYPPFEEGGIDWATLKPDWVDQHGTVIVLLGAGPQCDTVLGDPRRGEADIKGISTYLNRRVWQVPDGMLVTVDELRSTNRDQWPESEAMAHRDGGAKRRTNSRSLAGARHYVCYPGSVEGRLASSGTVSLEDETEIDWYLWEGERPQVHSYAAKVGFIAALYRNELYDLQTHHATYRTFGVSESHVRARLWLIARPPHLEDGRRGVYPRTDRNALLIKGGPRAGQPLPWNEWASEFADKMPQEIRDAIRAARAGGDGTLDDDSWKTRLAERFGSRWRIEKLRVDKGGTSLTSPTQPGTTHRPRPRLRPRGRRTKGGSGATGGSPALGVSPGEVNASKRKVAGGVPSYRWVCADDLGEPGYLAAWMTSDPEYPEGVVLLDAEHEVIGQLIEYWQALFPDHHSDLVVEELKSIYGEIAVAKVAHSEHLKSVLPSDTVEQKLRSPEALTMALLGLFSEETLISQRLTQKLGKLRRTA